jgi:hypothetical protein
VYPDEGGAVVHVKGSMILGRVSYITHAFADRYDAFVAALSPDTRAALAARVLKSSWYPFDMFLDASSTAEKMFGNGDYMLVRKMAAHSARINMPTIYKIFLRFGSPEHMISRVPQIWKVQYDSGVATSLIRPEGGGGAVELRDFGQPDPLHCHGVTGFMEECLRLVHVKSFELSHTQCRCDGADVCRWDGTWA